MRKLATLALAVLMVVSLLSVSAFAESYIENDVCEVSFEIKKANPANVIKDGIIGDGEYTEVTVDKIMLMLNFGTSQEFGYADTMANTCHWYFSWDETHGLNFAVVYDAKDGFNTSIPQASVDENGKMVDDFCYNVGLNFSSGRNEGMPYFYYSIGKDISTGKYLVGHYNQLGAAGTFEAVGGKDFEVSYNGTICTFEWSVPFSAINVNATAGSTVEINLAACAGAAQQPADDGSYTATGSYSVGLGQFGFLCSQTKTNKAAIGTLSDELIPGGTVVTTGAGGDETTPAPTQTAESTTAIVTETVAVTDEKGDAVTDEKGDVVTEVITSVVTNAPVNNEGGVTGDPAVIAAVVAAISACGVVVAKKRK